MKRILKRVCSVLLALIIWINSTDLSIFAAENISIEQAVNNNSVSEGDSISGGDSISTSENDNLIEGNLISIYAAENYQVTFEITDYWESSYNVVVTIENIGKEEIEDWCVEMPFSQPIVQIYNAKIEEKTEDYYLIKNVEWNQDIPVGQSIIFGFMVEGNTKEFPQEYKLLGEKKGTSKEDYEIVYEISNDWETGFNGKIIIKNISDKSIEDWCLECDFENEITTIWNGEILLREGSKYIIGNSEYNQNIYPNSSIEIGFVVSEGDATNVISNMVLTNINTKNNLDIMTISENGLLLNNKEYLLQADFTGFSGTLERVDEVTEFKMYVYDKDENLIYETNIEPKEEWAVSNMGLIFGYNKVVFVAGIDDKIDKKEMIINCETNCYFKNLNVDLNDFDNDGLPNYFESYFDTRNDIVDSDEDGLTDYQELYYLGYDPLSVDTDNDGISDFNEDEDSDNIYNGVEFKIGSHPLDNDSDNDLLLDNEEMDFGTSPILEDSNADGITDYEEYQLNVMKANYDTNTGSYIAEFSADTMGILYDEAVIPSVKLIADAEGIFNFKIEKVESNMILNPTMVGYLGAAYNFSTSGTMESAELTFTYNVDLINPEIINSEDFCPAIYYYNPVNGRLEEVEGQVWEGNRVTVKLSHFSIYILVNKSDLEELWNSTLDIEEGTDLISGNHVVFVLDKSGSMSWNDPYYIRTSLISEFAEQLGDKDKMGLVGFADCAVGYTNELTNDKTQIDDAIELFEKQSDDGGTYLNSAIELAVRMLETENEDECIQKCIFVLTDGETSDYITDAYLKQLKEKDIIIYTVGLGSVSEAYLKRIANNTKGKYFYAKTSSDLSEVFVDFEGEIKNYDVNNDGLNDEVMKLICEGKITTESGTRIFNDMYESVMANSDFDGDGLTNGEEIEIYFIKEKPFYKLISSPELLDTDHDFYTDYEEIYKLGTDPQSVNYIIESEDVIYVNSYSNFEAGKAFDDYINSDIEDIIIEQLGDILLCGGEVSLVKNVVRKC